MGFIHISAAENIERVLFRDKLVENVNLTKISTSSENICIFRREVISCGVFHDWLDLRRSVH